MQIAKLGPERNKQIGEKRGEKPRCNTNSSRCPSWGKGGICTLDVNCVSKGHLPYSSDLNVTMRLMGDGWVFYMGRSWDKEHENEWNCRILVKGKVYEAFAATPALAMIDAITRAWLEVQD